MSSVAMKPDKAFILAAGYGERMRPLTLTRPKPLLEVGGQSLLDRALDQLEAFGIRDVVVNTHYLAEKIEDALKDRHAPRIHLSHEPDILDTGGGMVHALRYFDDRPFFVLNGDGYWIDGPQGAALDSLWRAWDDRRMDIALSLQPVAQMTLTRGVGDYDLDDQDLARRSKSKTGAYMFNGLRLHHPRIFKDAPRGAFSYLTLMDRAENAGRLYGVINPGIWHHISTPADFDAVNASLMKDKVG